MEQYVIKGGNPLYGEVEIGGAKNAALAILAAAIMTDETVTIDNLPNVRDINVLLQAIEEIGAHVERVDIHKVKINGSFIRGVNVDNEFRSILPPNILFSIYTIVIHPTTNFIYDDVFKPPFVPVLLLINDAAATII